MTSRGQSIRGALHALRLLLRQKMIITVTKAWIKQGYSGEDHLNGDLSGMVGNTYKSPEEAEGAAIEGTVQVKHRPLVECFECGRKTTVPGRQHRARYVEPPCGHLHQVNCVGEVLVPCQRCA